MKELGHVHGHRQHLRGVFKAQQDLPAQQKADRAIGPLGGDNLRQQRIRAVLQQLLQHAQGGYIIHIAAVQAALDLIDILLARHAVQIQDAHARRHARADACRLADQRGRAHHAPQQHHVVAQRFRKRLLRPLHHQLARGALHAALGKALGVQRDGSVNLLAQQQRVAVHQAANGRGQARGGRGAGNGQDRPQQRILVEGHVPRALAGRDHPAQQLVIVRHAVDVKQRRAPSQHAEAAQHRILAHRPAQGIGYQLYLFIKIARQRGVACIFQWHGAPSI